MLYAFLPTIFFGYSIVAFVLLRPLEFSSYRNFTFIIYLFSTLTVFYYAALRGDYGTDYENYVLLLAYENYNDLEALGPLFFALKKMLLHLVPSSYIPQIFFLVTGFSSLYFIAQISKRFDGHKWQLSLFLYSSLYVSFFLGSIKQGLAILIISLVFIMLISREQPSFLKITLLALLACLCHVGGVAVLLPIVLFYRIGRRSLGVIFVLLFSLAVFILTQGDSFSGRLSVYSFSEGYTSGVPSISRLIWLPLLVLAFCYARCLAFKLAVVYSVSLLLPYLFIDFPVISERIAGFFDFYKLGLLKLFVDHEKHLLFFFTMLLLFLASSWQVYRHLQVWGEYF